MDASTALRYLLEQHRLIVSAYSGSYRRHARGEHVHPVELLAIRIIQADEAKDIAALVKLAGEWKACGK